MTTVALLFPLGGPMAASGRECVAGASLVLRAAGHEVVAADATAGDPAETARRLARDGASVVVGTLLSALALPASAAAVQVGATFVEAAAVADELGGRGLRAFARTAPRASAFGDRAASFALDVAIPALMPAARRARVAVLYEGSAFGRSLGAAALARVRAGRADVALEIEVPAGSVDVDDPAERLASARPDVVFAACYTATAQALWRALRPFVSWPLAMIGVGGGWLHLGEGRDAPDPDGVFVVDVAPSLSLRAAGLLPEIRGARDRYVAAYRSAHGEGPTVYADLGYAAGAVLADGLAAASSDAPDAIGRALRSLDVPEGGTVLGYGVRFDAAGENVRAAPTVMQWHSRELRVVYPPALATHDPVVAAPAGAPA